MITPEIDTPSGVGPDEAPPVGVQSAEFVISYPSQLPVSQRREDIAQAIRDHQVVIVAGETGSGKTTQLPKICLELGRGVRRKGSGGLIGHTQPRRIAARAVATRIAEELGTELGDLVGYQVRFTDQTSRNSRVKLMTDGILLAELQRDRQLRKYDTIIIDEAHERSLNIDFLLGYLKQLLPMRPDLKLIITSATIDPERFAAHFADRHGKPAPIIEVSGRTFPVEVRYRPLVAIAEADEDGEPVVRDQTEAIVDAVREVLGASTDGDTLVFLPGEREIRDTADALGATSANISRPGRKLEIVPLYSRLSSAEQQRVFSSHPASVRRVVLATNVAETSLTVPGITSVIDTGVARISRYSVRTKVQRLPIEAISQASAQQRSGRCGRVAAGIAIRLYAEEDFAARPEFTTPEILRTNLASVILQMASLGLGDVARFGFIDPPDRRAIAAGVQLLEELGALSPQGRLTKLGRRLARLPIDPRLGRMILEAERLGCVREVLVISAALSLQDPRERPAEQRPKADQFHTRFTDQRSDFMTWMNLWRYLTEQQQELSSSAFRRMCKREFLNYLRVREWQDFESQLRQVAKEMGIRLGPKADLKAGIAEDAVHQALLSGLLSQIGTLEERESTRPGERKAQRPAQREYAGARGTRFAIFPGSGLRGKNPQFLMAGELVETSRLWARQNAAIEPEWAERIGAHLVKRTHSEPHWSAKRTAVMAYERVTLYGVTLVANRLINYATIDPPLARELFIRHALVYGDWSPDERGRHSFFAKNRRLLEEASELEHRARRRDIVVDEHALFDFYDARVGSEAVSGAHFDTWWKAVRREQPEFLTFNPEMLTRDTADEISDSDFPIRWSSDDSLNFALSYHFEPGAAEDGVTIDLPVLTLNRVEADEFSWNVPGLREELVTALIRSLPKSLRVNFVPAPNRAREFLGAVPPGEEPLLAALERYFRATTGVHVPREAWDWAKVPEHLRPTFRIIDDAGRETAKGKDLDALKAPLKPQFAKALTEAMTHAMDSVAGVAGAATTGQTTWTFGVLEESFVTVRAGHQVVAYPALTDQGKSVGLRAFGSADEALAHHREGVRRLLLLALADPSTKIMSSLSNAEKLGLAVAPYPSVVDLLQDCRSAAVVDVLDAWPTVRTPAAYDELLRSATTDHETSTRTVLATVIEVFAAWRAAERLLSGRAELSQLPALTDLQSQLARLVYPGFVGDSGLRNLRNYPRYLNALAHRRGRLDEQVNADRILMDRVMEVNTAYLDRLAALPPGAPATESLRKVRWLIEEFRVSLWAQHLGTAQPVSDQRIRKALVG